MQRPVMTGTPHQTKAHVRQLMAEDLVSARDSLLFGTAYQQGWFSRSDIDKGHHDD
jgi:hypothetical protein